MGLFSRNNDTTTDDIARQIVDIAVQHGGDSDEARLAMDNLLMDHGPDAIQEAGRRLFGRH
jgi:hypothetical protein